MTELMILLGFLIQLAKSPNHSYPGVTLDIDALTKITEFIRSAKADAYFKTVISDLCRLDDAIVTGLAIHGQSNTDFVYTSSVFAKKRGPSTLPRFLYGLLTTVFHDNGKLKSDFSIKSVDCLLVCLRLVRRAKHKSFTKLAADTAAQKFIMQQIEVAPATDSTLEDMAELWESFETQSTFSESIKPGFPGNGVCIDMQLPYVPDLCFIRPLDNETIPTHVSKALDVANQNLFSAAGHRVLGNSYRIPSGNYTGVYPIVPFAVTKLSIVPKKFDEGRAITTAYVGNTILGAACRNSIFEHHRINGTISMVNVKDQSSSAKVLEDHFSSVSCIDLKGGSSCFTTDRLDRMLFKTTFVLPMWKASRPTQFNWKGAIHDLKTLTMGDAASVALLTTTLWLCCVLAVMRQEHLDPYKYADYETAVKLMLSDGRFRVVGDDIIVPNKYLVKLRAILKEIGVVINERKSSGPNSLHKESCGAWFIKHQFSSKPVRIYPFRAAVGTHRDLETVTSLIEQYVDKNYNSDFSGALFKAHTSVLLPLDDRIKYELLLSRSAAHVGSPFGTHWSNIVRKTRAIKPAKIDEGLAYACRISESQVIPRYRRTAIGLPSNFRVQNDDREYRRSKQFHIAKALILLITAQSNPSLCLFLTNSRFKSHYVKFSKPPVVLKGC